MALAAGGCNRGEHARFDDPDDEPERDEPAATSKVTAAPPVVVDSGAVRANVGAEEDSVRAAFAKVSVLRWREVWGLHRDKNAEQIAVAERIGIRAGNQAEIDRLVKAGRLVALGDSTPYWVLRKMTHSVPYVTPDARANLIDVGKRFQARLDSAGLPRYRMKVTSALRTNETQVELRKINPNASQIVSSHEFGTTVDVSHERFAAPAPASAAPEVAQARTAMLEQVGKENGKALQALLGRTLADMRDEGALMVMMEDRQPVYHFTVARRR